MNQELGIALGFFVGIAGLVLTAIRHFNQWVDSQKLEAQKSANIRSDIDTLKNEFKEFAGEAKRHWEISRERAEAVNKRIDDVLLQFQSRMKR